MGSRIGSIAILLVIAGIVAAVVVVINRLDLLNTGEPDAPVMIVSLDEGELLLLNEPQSITVTISSGSPIATLELFVDDVKVADVLAAYSQDRGAWIGNFVWTPARLGFANVRVVALDDNGIESATQVRVEVTDDEARVAAALRVTVLGISPLQQFPTGSTILLAISATGSQPIERFEMLTNGDLIVAVTPRFDETTSRYVANIEWTAGETGEVEVTIVAVDAAGREESQTIPIVLIPQDGSPRPTESEEQAQDASAETETATNDAGVDDIGVARIESPSDGQQFMFDADFSLDVQLTASNVGTVASALLYITPIAPDETFGSSVLIHSSEGHPAGDYSERVTDVQRWITSSGAYELELVIFTPGNDRYGDRIVIYVVAVVDQSSDDPESDEQGDEPSTSEEIDLAIVAARQANDDRARLNVTITNASAVDIERADVLLIVADTNSGAELASTAVTLDIESDGLRTIPLDLDLQPGASIEASVVLEANIDTDTSNNVYSISLAAPEPEPDEPQELEPPEPDEPAEEDVQEQDEQPETTEPSPDLTFHEAQVTSDGYILITVINNGDAPARTFSIIVTNQVGDELEVISRGAGGAQPLLPGGTEILASMQPHAGVITIIVVAESEVPEHNLDDNEMMIEVSG